MFESRARSLQTRPNSFLGIVGGFPQVLSESARLAEAERDVSVALSAFLRSREEPYGPRVEYDEFPTDRDPRFWLVGPRS